MGDLSRSFNRSEFACRDGCGFDTVDVELIAMLQEIRDYYDAPVIITSGCRCPNHNESVGGSKGSQHLLGRAADFVVRGVEPAEVAAFAERLSPGGIGNYKTFSHIDTRSNGPIRWEG